MARKIKLHIGCGFDKKKGFVNIDIIPEVNPDYVIDLNKDKLPFKDNTVDYIYSRHVFEHIKNFEVALTECHRVLKPTGKMDMILPYATALGGDYEYHYIRPRFWVFKDFEGKGVQDQNRGMSISTLPKYTIKRYLTFPWYTKFMQHITNFKPKLMYMYETSGLRYIFPGHELHLEFKKIIKGGKE